MKVSPEQTLQARLVARFLLAYGEDTNVNTGLGGGQFAYCHLGRTYFVTFTIMAGGLTCSEVYAEGWNIKLWFNGPGTRKLTDIRGRTLHEFYHVEHLPFFGLIGSVLSECRGGLIEAEDVQFAFWQHTFGKLGRSRIHQSGFHGSSDTFDRDMLMLKMDDRFKHEIGGL